VRPRGELLHIIAQDCSRIFEKMIDPKLLVLYLNVDLLCLQNYVSTN